jgi:hypothetical protein
MPLPLLQPKFTAFVPGTATPLVGGQVFTYQAGTSTPLATYPTYTDALNLTNVNANPVILDANGQANIWAPDSYWYKIVLEDAGSNVIYTVDNYHPSEAAGIPFSPTNSSVPVAYDWLPIINALGSNVIVAPTLTFVSSTSFTLGGNDFTGVLHPGRRIRSVNTGGTAYSTVRTSTFGGGNTTVNVVNDSTVLDSGLSQLYYGSQPYVNPAYLDPRTALNVTKNGNQTGFGGAGASITGWTVNVDNNGEFSSNTWQNKYPGNYLVNIQIEISDTGASQALTMAINSNATPFLLADVTWSTAGVHRNYSMTHIFNYNAANQSSMTLSLQGSANTTVYGANSVWTVARIP